jgi:hypothetical protein
VAEHHAYFDELDASRDKQRRNAVSQVTEAKSFEQWQAEGRRASADEIALSKVLRKPWHCVGTS